ncbi:MFS transporter [Urbifossiella limnaea]|uniref:Major Facilitator Superfamily protein n=1 Tax=Urbifossiella limnaea TaxID=2528023 RepID=A0A517Y0G6_9BACT|nr:MFS transporter [Urbifossiella limnaea]QDU23252.1 Major Facilitator Superfamily protein [Urbifossiella limnaea]
MNGATRSADRPSLNDRILFWASFATLIAAGIGFSVRGAIVKDWGQQFGFTQAELGTINGGGLWGFGLAIIFFSFLADRFGYGRLMAVAFLLHASSAILTFAATPVYNAYGKTAAFTCLNLGMWLFAFGNGTCEAVINPLTATLFPKNKTHWLNILHAGWPLGLILGAVILLGFNYSGETIRWEYKLGVFLVPVLAYGLMMFNRPFPRSEADTAGVSMPDQMGTIGMVGVAAAVGLFGLTLNTQILPMISKAVNVEFPAWLGWAGAGAVWLAYAGATRFAFGSILILFLYVMHALVGYVELGTDSWITNITERVLVNQNTALMVFIWTNLLMFTLRFFAGPIVHKINPIGLLFVSALLGTAGLFMLGLPFTDSVVPWVLAVTVYGIGKTFYWPTLLGVISERFPKGGALALGLSGGTGMLAAGLLGSPGIGYKQDYFAVEKITATSPATYARYKAPEPSGFPLVTDLAPAEAPPVAGLDNAKLKVFDDYAAGTDDKGVRKPDAKPTTLDADLATIAEQEKEGKPVEAKLKESLSKLKSWWEAEGRPNFVTDQKPLDEARTYGAKTALKWTAAIPAVLAAGFLLLILYFAATGGYKPVELTGPTSRDPRDKYGAPAEHWGR